MCCGSYEEQALDRNNPFPKISQEHQMHVYYIMWNDSKIYRRMVKITELHFVPVFPDGI